MIIVFNAVVYYTVAAAATTESIVQKKLIRSEQEQHGFNTACTQFKGETEKRGWASS